MFLRAKNENGCQPAASIRFVSTIATDRPITINPAASRSRRAAWRISSAGIAHAGATTPVPIGLRVRGRVTGRAPRPAVWGAGSLCASVGIASCERASDSRQAEQRSSTAAAPLKAAPHCGHVRGAGVVRVIAAASSAAAPQRLEHPADLGVHVSGVGDGARHFLSQQACEAAA